MVGLLFWLVIPSDRNPVHTYRPNVRLKIKYDSSTKTCHFDLTTTRDCLRGTQVSLEKEAKCYRIFCLGNSETAGFDVSFENTYSKKLEGC